VLLHAVEVSTRPVSLKETQTAVDAHDLMEYVDDSKQIASRKPEVRDRKRFNAQEIRTIGTD